MKEVSLHRYAGPFEQIPFDRYIQSLIGLVPKAGGQTCLIFYLSYNFPESGYKSVNSYNPKERCCVKYKDLDHAVSNSLKILQCLQERFGLIWYGKSDLKSAFRVLPGDPDSYWMMVMMAKHPLTGKVLFYRLVPTIWTQYQLLTLSGFFSCISIHVAIFGQA